MTSKSDLNTRRKSRKLACAPLAAVSAMTMTTTDDITEGCQTRENSVIEPRARGSAPLLAALVRAIFTFTMLNIKLNFN